jgi:hypothetical protein
VNYVTGGAWTTQPEVQNWYNYSTWENLESGAYETYADYRTGGYIYFQNDPRWNHYDYDYQQSQENGEDLDRTYSTYYIRTNAYQYSYELETLANGAQFQWAYWNSYADDYRVWLKLANPTGTAWSGTGIVDNMMGTYLYYYSAFPNDYFVVENPAYIPDNFYYWD